MSYSSSSVNESISFEHAYEIPSTSTPKPKKSKPILNKYQDQLARAQSQVRSLRLKQKRIRMKIVNEKKAGQSIDELSQKTKVQVCHEMLSKSGKFTKTHINNLLKIKGK